MNYEGVDKVYFIGIGGIGMSALAQYFLHQGCQVTGYDRTPSEITELLEEKNIAILFEDNVDKIPHEFKNKEAMLVVYTPAIPANNTILEYFSAHGFLIKKRAQVLADVVSLPILLKLQNIN
jgi:UDP-N-acetylmuramate--alanine ligase